MTTPKASGLVERLRDASLEDGQAAWMWPSPPWAERSQLLSDAADALEAKDATLTAQAQRIKELERALEMWLTPSGQPFNVNAAIAESERLLQDKPNG